MATYLSFENVGGKEELTNIGPFAWVRCSFVDIMVRDLGSGPMDEYSIAYWCNGLKRWFLWQPVYEKLQELGHVLTKEMVHEGFAGYVCHGHPLE